MIEVKMTSDTHFFHENIIRYCGRPFRDIPHMHEVMIGEWNSVVGDDDIIIHMGDMFCGGSSEEIADLISQLNGFKILITGNHDRKGIQWLVDHGIDRVFKHRWVIGGYAFTHRPQEPRYLVENNIKLNYHGHSHKHQYGSIFRNVGVDVVGFKPVTVKLDLEEGDLRFKSGKGEPEISWL